MNSEWEKPIFLAFQILDQQEMEPWFRSVCRYRACFTSHELGMGKQREECCRAADCLLSEGFLLGRILSIRAAQSCWGMQRSCRWGWEYSLILLCSATSYSIIKCSLEMGTKTARRARQGRRSAFNEKVVYAQHFSYYNDKMDTKQLHSRPLLFLRLYFFQIIENKTSKKKGGNKKGKRKLPSDNNHLLS